MINERSGNTLTFRHQCASTHQTILADHCAVHYNSLNADKAAVAYSTAVQHRLVSHRHTAPCLERHPWVGMQYGPFLDVTIFPPLRCCRCLHG